MEKSIIIHGQPLHYRVIGNGSPVLLLHGFGEDSRIWSKIEHALAEAYQLIIPDIPGSGKSALWPDDKASMEGFAEGLKEVLDAEHIATCTMIGHSMGGYITLAFAETFPERLDGFALFHSTADPDSEEKKETRRKGIAFMQEHGARLFLRQSIPGLFAESFRIDHPDEVEELVARGNEFTVEALRQYYRAMIQRPDRKEVLKKSAVPVLFVIGEEDKTVNLPDVLFQSHLPAISHVYVWPGLGHMGMREVPQRSVEALMKFLRHAKAHPFEQAGPPHTRS